MKSFLLQIFTWWNGQTLGTRFFTFRKGERVGSDEAGNIYYQERRGKRRWVIYNGDADASRIPPGWHGWMHHRVSEPPAESGERKFHWIKPHLPNRTGTANAYRPDGSIAGDNKRPEVTGDYEAWSPDQKH